MASLVPWNYTIPDSSPIFTYKPYSDGNGLGLGWQTWYTGSGFNSNEGALPSGDSFHLTSLQGASVSLSFYGNGIVLQGTSNCTYTVTLDNSIVPISNDSSTPAISDVLFSITDLSPGLHDVTLTAQPEDGLQVLSFSGGVVYSVTNSTLSSPNTVTYDNQNTSFVYSGNWQANKTAPGIPSTQSELPFHSTSQKGASAHLNFTGRSVAVYGSTTFGHGLYTVELDGKSTVLNGTSAWLVGNMLLFHQDGLDESVQHTLTLMDSSDGQPFSLNSVVVTQFNPDTAVNGGQNSSSSSSSPTEGPASHRTSDVGKIVGPIVAVIVLIIAFILFYFRKAVFGRKQKIDNYICTAEEEVEIIPFVTDPPTRAQIIEKQERLMSAPQSQFSQGTSPIGGRPSKSMQYTPRAPPSETIAWEGSEVTSNPSAFEQSSSQSRGSDAGLVSPALQDESLVDRIVEMVSRRIDPRIHSQEGHAESTAEAADYPLPPYRESI